MGKSFIFLLILFVNFFAVINIFFGQDSRKTDVEKLSNKYLIQDSGSFNAIKTNISPIISSYGISAAIDLVTLGFAQDKLSSSQCHILLHQIGHAAYTLSQGNLDSIILNKGNICQEAYPHGVEAELAIESKNLDEDLVSLCNKLKVFFPNYGCYHGAGHSFFENTNDLPKALGTCESLSNFQSYIHNCYTGVFSEYGNRAAGFDGNTGVRTEGVPQVKINPEDPLEICLQVDEKYQIACISQLVKVVYDYLDFDKAIKTCLDKFSDQILSTCIRFMSALNSDHYLSKDRTITLPKNLLTTRDLRIDFIAGTYQGYKTYSQVGVDKDFASFCNLFEDVKEKEACLEFKYYYQ